MKVYTHTHIYTRKTDEFFETRDSAGTKLIYTTITSSSKQAETERASDFTWNTKSVLLTPSESFESFRKPFT